MNFFEQQQRTRQQTLVLVLLFTTAVIAIVATTDMAVVGALWLFGAARIDAPTFDRWLHLHPHLWVWTSVIATGLIVGASLYRWLSLRRGGGAVARLLGGVRVDPGTRDPARRQLLNVVEETAIAAGLPVPEVYVLETEAGINAFAAGYSPSDAAIAVTRGALDSLTRDELQGVIGHEFSHILNLDTRLNMHLISASFGILAIALTGRMLLRAAAETRGSSRDEKALGGAYALGLLLFVIGSIGVVATRIMKAAVSRKRELLADASAVQFTRNPRGIAGALKKIAAYPLRSTITAAEGEEVSHMLICEPMGRLDALFDSHPPILERIKLLDPQFNPDELKTIKLAPMTALPPLAAELAPKPPVEAIGIAPHVVIARVGKPGGDALHTAAVLEKNIAPSLKDAAHSPEDSLPLVLALILNDDPAVRAMQLSHIGARRPTIATARIEQFAGQIARVDATQRMPLLELAFPALRQFPPLELRALIGLIDELVRMDGKTSVFEYVISRLLRQQLLEVLNPQLAGARRTAKLYDLRDEAQILFSLLAEMGHAGEDDARRAYDAGMRRLLPYGPPPPYTPPATWVASLDQALLRLDRLAPMFKQELVAALVITITFDREVTLAESELLRVVCALLHCPLPPLAAPAH